jgi:outer membrane biogenesis lipoprotein LolB
MPSSRISSLAARILTATLLVLSLAACATAPKPAPSAGPGRTVDTLQSEVSLSVKSGDKSIGGRGYLIFKRPDRFHLAVLSPFGFTMMDVFVADDRITCLIPSKQTAYQGRISDLPDRNALRGWGMMRWVVDTPRAEEGGGAGTREYLAADGRKELLSYDDRGLLVSKSNEDGDRVAYGEYHDRNGVAFPASIEMSNRQGDTVKIVFDEPEVNQPVEEAALSPVLEGVEVRSLADFRGL